jgi:hypothetical protein
VATGYAVLIGIDLVCTRAPHVNVLASVVLISYKHVLCFVVV